MLGYCDMAKKILKWCPKPTSMALFASSYYRLALQKLAKYDTEQREQYAMNADLFEGLASDILNQVEERDQVSVIGPHPGDRND